MLTISVLAGGKAKNAPEHALAIDYLTKARDAGRPLGFSGFTIAEADGSKLGQALAAAPHPILLDEAGKTRTSREFAHWLAQLRDQGLQTLTFVIGGADGWAGPDRKLAKSVMSFGVQTWPHLLVRPMLAEQLYRAMTILSGHPYHRDGSR